MVFRIASFAIGGKASWKISLAMKKKKTLTIAQTKGKKSQVYFGIYIAQNKILRVRQMSSNTHSRKPS